MSSQKSGSSPIGGYADRFWIPRYWNGILFLSWLRILARNGFRVNPRRWGMAILILLISVYNSITALFQNLLLGRAVARTNITEAPIFVVGHWRSGTTWLHELMVLDQRFACPDTYACFIPNHFLLTRSVVPKILFFLLPKVRPMDNMALAWDSPQEDEFAMCNMGYPSPYLRLIFPNRPPMDQEYLDFQGVPREKIERWKAGLLWFLKCVTWEKRKPLVLKSPPHTARIRVLLEMFPDARFVHIHRDPYVVFASTVHLWKRLARDQGLQVPHYRGLEEYILDTFVRMYEAFERDRQLLAPSQICDVSYEALVADPIGQMRRIYEQLQLGGFENVLPALKQHIASRADYKTNRYEITPEQRAAVEQRWAPYIQKYGYASAQANA